MEQNLNTPVYEARTYDYEGEAKCEMNVGIFFQCIEAVHNVSPEGFAAIKVTALGLPAILERFSKAILETQQLFSQLDKDGTGTLSREEFRGALLRFAPSLTGLEVEEFISKFSWKDSVDYIEWTNTIKLEEVFKLIQKSKEGPTELTNFTEEETQLVKNLFTRVNKIARFACEMKVRLMIDAEHSYFQPAIDHLVLDLQRTYNKEEPLIFQTYQCYLQNAFPKVINDLERANREGYWFAAKVVRGAYLELERARAKKMGYPDPICPTYDDTSDNYHRVLTKILQHINRSSVLVATHNETSISMVLTEIEKQNDVTRGRVYFGQLLGMSDRLTFNLGRGGYKAYKYIPYGPVQEVIPYLIRRAQENSSMLGGSAKELVMIRKALLGRLFPFLKLRKE